MLDFLRVVPKKRSVSLRSKRGVLFSNPNTIFRIIFYVGSLTFFTALAYLAYLYQPLVFAMVSYSTKNQSTHTASTAPPDPTPTAAPIVDKRFIVSIPKIAAENEIIKNVDVQSKSAYMEVLGSGKIAHALGSNLPGDGLGKSIYLFAHSTEQDFSMVRKNSVFYLLDKLENQDTVFLTDMGTNYLYRVYDKKIVSAQDTQYMRYSDPNKETLILQTCWPLGTNWKRLLVFAQRQM